MRNGCRVAVIIPALNEEGSVGRVVSAIPDWVDDIIVSDNGSTDRTAMVAQVHGARVVPEPRRGYGAACLAAMARLEDPDVVVFMDADFSDFPEETLLLVDPIVEGRADMVIGSRTLGMHEPGSLTPQARFGNWLACRLMALFWGVKCTDPGPFRAVSYGALLSLDMRDLDYGWNIEMQIKAAVKGLEVLEVPVSYRKRIGKSKVSGTIRGVVGAGTKILYTIYQGAAGSLAGLDRRCTSEQLIIFTRYPEPGKTKTRLIPILGADAAADLHRLTAEHTVQKMHRLQRECGVSIHVLFEGGDDSLMRSWLGEDVAYLEQAEGDLGRRMLNAFESAFRTGAKRAVIVGTDLPGLSARIVQRAFHELQRKELVLGPANDGGYYLIGMKHPHRRLFDTVPWGTDKALEVTLRIADAEGLSVSLVDSLDDLDMPEDLDRWANHISLLRSEPAGTRSQSEPGRISVIIPALNEEACLPACLASVCVASDAEVILVDGGSTDRSVALAKSYGVEVLKCAAGRSSQANMGARHASGSILLFLHADTLLPENWSELVRSALNLPGVSAGAFRFQLDADGLRFRIVERLTNFRSEKLRMPYGDQALFMKRETFEAAGGFPPIPIMEDFELVRQLRKLGRIHTLRAGAITSARRWKDLGVLKTTAINQIVIAAYFLGIRPETLKRIYRH